MNESDEAELPPAVRLLALWVAVSVGLLLIVEVVGELAVGEPMRWTSAATWGVCAACRHAIVTLA